MSDLREERIAAAKRKLRKFKQKRGRELKTLKDDASSVASEETIDENIVGDSLSHCENGTSNTNSIYVEDNSEASNHVSGHYKQNSDVYSITKPELENGQTILSASALKDTNFPVSLNPEISAAMMVTLHQNENDPETHKDVSISKNEGIYEQENSTEPPVADLITLDIPNPVNNGQVNEMVNTVGTHPVHHLDKMDEISSSTETAEKLLQISTKLNGLATEAQHVMSSVNEESLGSTAHEVVLSDFEHRNQQLAEQLSSMTRQKQELTVQVANLSKQMSELHQRLESEKQQIYTHGVQEQNTLRQQLQVQMQTIGVLVAEKQELQHQIHEVRAAATQEQNSRQRCQDQLQDTKLRLQTIERDLNNKTDAVHDLITTKEELVQEREQLQMILRQTNKSNEENSMHAKELSQKLQTKEEECKQLSVETDDLHEKLSMAEVLLQQLSNSSGATAETQVQQLQDERENLNQKLIEYQQAFEQLTGEREQLSRQYEDVNEQMRVQVSDLSRQISVLEGEKHDLQEEIESLHHHIQEIETKTREESNTDKGDMDVSVMMEISSKLEETKSELQRVMSERDEANNKLHLQLRNNERLARLNEEQELQLSEVNRNMTESVVSADEHARLLEQSQNDKTTISRALAQNKQLKQQLEEMHDGFIKLSNDKMELASELTSSDHSKKELEDEVDKYKGALNEIHERLRSKEAEVSQLQSSLLQAEISPGETGSSQPENENVSNDVMQGELIASQETITILGEQNNQLKSMVTNLQEEVDKLQHELRTEQQHASKHQPSEKAEAEKPAMIDTTDALSASLDHLQKERDLLARQCEEQRQQHASLMQQFLQLQETQKESGVVSNQDHEKLVHDMNLLQERFTAVMKEKVDALNRIEELEHVNLQLQNECDTIGEYITLYHNQRQILKQRHHEKDEYVSAIAQEREQMQLKLEKLQTLVLTLLNSRGASNTTPITSSPLKAEGSIPNDAVDWPSMIEDDDGKPMRKQRPDLLPETASLPSDDGSYVENNKQSSPGQHDHFPGKLQRIEGSSVAADDSQTANQIINLLEQMQHPNKSDRTDIPQGFCLRYMGPYTAI